MEEGLQQIRTIDGKARVEDFLKKILTNAVFSALVVVVVVAARALSMYLVVATVAASKLQKT